MPGQGSPLFFEPLGKATAMRGRWLCRCALLTILGISLLVAVAGFGQEVDLELRAAWGGGPGRCWQGQFRLEGPTLAATAVGEISDVRPVGLSPDQPGSIYQEGQTIRVSPRMSRDYDAVDFRLRASPDSVLLIELAPKDQPGAGHEWAIPVSQLIDDGHSSLLDDRGNQLRVRRTPGDQLRVRFDRDSLVFGGGESFDFTIVPYLLPVEADSTLTCEVVLRETRDTARLWENSREFRIDGQRRAPELGPFSVPLPDRDGVFEVVITLNRRRLPTPFAQAKVVAQREVQVAVVSTAAVAAAGGIWNVTAEIIPQSNEMASDPDGGKPRLWSPLPKLPSWWWLPGSAGGEAKRPLGNAKARPAPRLGEGFVELEPGGWQAYPLPVGTVKQPHMVEVEYPADRLHGLNLRVIEANSAGVVTPFGPASGLDIEPSGSGAAGRIERQRLVFWPQTQTALLLVSNTRPDAAAVFGRMRVSTGPRQLPPRKLPRDRDARLLAAFYDRPLFPEDFSAADTVDLVTGRNLNDWLTFHEGSARLASYLPFAGYNGAMIAVLHDGGTLYPSRLLEPTPRYENGTFFGTGQDPIRKDVLELMFRTFDRESIQLIPMLQFSTPLPELETQLREPTEGVGMAVRIASSAAATSPTVDSTGIELVGADGRSWRHGAGADRAAGPYYNILDPRVQQAIRRVVVELVDRYADHSSFGGVAVRLGPDTFAQLPDLAWGLDRLTLSRFAKDTGRVPPGEGGTDARPVLVWPDEETRDAWLAWRAGKVAEFYRALESDVTDRVAEARLYLAGADMLSGSAIRADMQPKLPNRLDLRQLMLRVGIDPLRYADSPNLVLLRPERTAPLISLEEQAVNLQLRDSPEMDQLYASASPSTTATTLRPLTGSLCYQEPQTLVPASFAAVSPFGADKTSNWFLSQTVPTGDRSRRRFVHSLAAMDSQVIVEGGWMAGQVPLESMADVVAAYRRLPAARFETVPSASAGDGQQPVVLRRLATSHRTYLYLVNDSPWPVSASLDLDDRRPFTIEVLGDRSLPAMTRSGQNLNWSVDLRPYDLVAASLSAPDVQIRDWRVSLGREVLVELRQSLDDVGKRASQLRMPQPLPVLTNPGFEIPLSGELLPGWDIARGEGISVRLDSRAACDGQNSLHVQSNGSVVWVRSNPFPTPVTGRLAVQVWLKIDSPDRQPPLQLAIDGRLNGEPYYRPARLGAASTAGRTTPPPLTTTWEPYVVRVDNLPPHVTDLRVAVDLMGAGAVWVDQVQVFDLYFDPNERKELLKLIALADFYLGKARETGDGPVAATECERILRSYWAEFLRRYVPLDVPQLTANPQTASPRPLGNPPSSAASDRPTPEAPTSWFQRVVPKAPKLPRIIR